MHDAIHQSKRPRVAMVQDAARLHYAIPLAMQRAGILDRRYTDVYVKPGSATAFASAVISRWKPSVGKSLAGRYCEELDPSRVRTNPMLAWRYLRRRPPNPIPASFWEWSCAQVGEWIRRVGFGRSNLIMGFVNSIDPQLLAHARDRGLVTVGDQMSAPVAEAVRIAEHLQKKWPGWESAETIDVLRQLEPLQLRTWERLDHMTCASDYVRSGLVAAGIESSRITVIPYPIDTGHKVTVDRSDRKRPVTVGCVSRVTLAKGAPYFFEVARQFDPREVKFVMVGPIGAPESVVAENKGHVELIGGVPRADVAKWLAEFDIFFFPATCEGSSGAVIEAMHCGLPVVTSPNSGTFARHGVDGFIHAFEDTAAMAESLRILAGDSSMRRRMGDSASGLVRQYDVNAYGRRANELFSSLLDKGSP